MSLLSLLALSLAPLTAKLRDSPDVALTRATAKIAELEQSLADLTVRTEALERSIDRMRAESRQMTQHELIEAQRLAMQSQMMQSQQWMQQNENVQMAQLAQQMQNYVDPGMLNDPRAREAYIRNCTPGRAEVLRRSP